MLTFLPFSQYCKQTENAGKKVTFPASDDRFCDLTPGNLLVWEDYLSSCCAEADGRLYLRFRRLDGRLCHMTADGKITEEDLNRLAASARAEGTELCLFPLSPAKAEALAAACGGRVTTVLGTADYLYDAEALSTFHGHRYNGQRNHINKFLSLYADWACVPAAEVGGDLLREFLDRYFAQTVAGAPAHEAEHTATCRLLSLPGLGGMCADVLLAGGRPVAMAMGEVLGDTLYVHVEKAFREVPGAYQMIVREFTARHTGDGVRYVNREEDDGNEGLRTAKEALHPVALLEKCEVLLPAEKL